MTASRIAYLFNCYVNKNCSKEEKDELMELLSQPENEATFKLLIEEFIKNTGADLKMPAAKADSILANILEADKAVIVPLKKQRPVSFPWMRVAAAALLVVAGASYWLLPSKNNMDEPAKVVAATSKPVKILPGTDKAVLTMADGSTIILDSMQNGVLVQPGNTQVQKQGAVLVYNSAASEKNKVTYNTLSTPRGGQYKVVLDDGSAVWLNAASSLRFPTAFAGAVREVELTGEAYFEVARNKKKPFHVLVNGMRVEVLGTHFNINAYAEEQNIKTSLLEGSVQVVNGSSSSRLKPGEQAIVSGKEAAINIKNPNMDAVMAWKNGLFEFEGADIATIMRQISRWYDVEIAYSGKIPPRRFEGKISRNAQLSDVLQILELSGIKFKVEGRKIIVQ